MRGRSNIGSASSSVLTGGAVRGNSSTRAVESVKIGVRVCRGTASTATGSLTVSGTNDVASAVVRLRLVPASNCNRNDGYRSLRGLRDL